jgi:thioredoxin reductase (NADPH)
MELADRAVIQARRFGAQITVPAGVVSLANEDGRHLVALDTGEQLAARAVLVATGVHYRRLDVPGVGQLAASIYYTATPVEAAMCRNDPVAIVGGGNSAGQAAVFLADHAAQVHLIVRNAELDQDMSRYLADRIARIPGIEVHLRTQVRELVGNRLMEKVIIEHLDTGETSTLDARSLFVFIGSEPNVQWLGGSLALDPNGFILTGQAATSHVGGEQGDARLLLLETTRRGVFVAGDVRSGSVKRVAGAVGDGSLAVRLVHERLGNG